MVLTVPDELSLHREAKRLTAAGVSFTAISEPDEPYQGALMALGLHPQPKEVLRRLLSSLPLLR